MKKFLRLFAIATVGVMGASCTTSYDAYGNRRQSVDPGAAAIGAVALGALAYSVGKNRGKQKEHRRHTRRDYYRGGGGYHGGYHDYGYHPRHRW